MARKEQVYDDIPGTFVFDAERSREGYGINMFCMSLMTDENRKAFKANEAEYLKQVQADAGASRGRSSSANTIACWSSAAISTSPPSSARPTGIRSSISPRVMTGKTQDDYAKMMLGGGRSVEGNRSRSGKNAPSPFIGGAAATKSRCREAESQSQGKNQG